tara:strand:- start:105 stop:887 length:783 start_codon:yes stop_codon:yes gene_type:complete
MKITLFTSNSLRHNYFINYLSKYCKELYVVQECKSIFTEKSYDTTSDTNLVQDYFKNVEKAQRKFFPSFYVKGQNISILSILYGELNKCPISYLKKFLKSDVYIVLGSSYIKGELVNFLIRKKAINIHAGVTPFYRGSDCNFWALFDNNPHLVGSTIHLLSKGLDDGPVLYHAMSKNKSNIFNYTMSTLLSAFKSIGKKIKDRSIFNIQPAVLDSSLEIRYTKKIQFNSQTLEKFYKKKINLNSKKFEKSLLKDPIFFDN